MKFANFNQIFFDELRHIKLLNCTEILKKKYFYFCFTILSDFIQLSNDVLEVYKQKIPFPRALYYMVYTNRT